ncbi:hypothetical protein D8B26_003818 [Coccidioides posadasii str. Silveira]|uniref:Uncharacterized protein n=3 Tax=Coccidioides posadasii TaxID=199306 RepID=E9D907_COCPS|nr:oxidoreductase,short chain dehydrogenase, putative [Coccidioides posadasii C735 delta SOWgp]EER29613.1 oxidoreductase,short chain dehydrogenase, putative [Coccidioides posadasii C735 delta SOWgp]EFW17041.1 conserved hypothetical protein [Coccidioides posadasii str. Silveira]KMM69955.1 hypothetical protein CPAG_06267 [Coccidioides posadasii RMSCC 3488]QVM09154.1 hypothetical protein D8B26_003818 [Coccidioides posadasii str. Silveira]|eukprot:XP_003071758.1 oxidoreductase,short chain dehydrogenase, putative [Coccidioides posadasii C735 delta SOWgp]
MATQPFTISPSSLRTLQDKTILITGGSSGIGLSTAELFLSLSPTNNISILDLSPPPSTSPLASPQNSRRVHFHKCNITVWKEQRAGFTATVSRFGYLDAVFVNAGIAEYGDQFFRDELDGTGGLKEPDRRVYDVDLAAANDTVKLAIYWMKKTIGMVEGGKRTGSIVMTASLAGYLASAGAPLYSAAKHGIVGLMRALKNDTATLNIAVSVVAPAITVTPIISSPSKRKNVDPAEWAAHMEKIGVPINKPESVALAVAHLVDLGMKANGMGLLVQKDRMVDVERGIAKSREQWMSKEMLDLFRGGRTAPLFENKL